MTVFCYIVPWILPGILCTFLFINTVLFSRAEAQTKFDALIMWIICPFRTLHGACLNQTGERLQMLYMISLVFFWPALIFFLPRAINGYRKEDGT